MLPADVAVRVAANSTGGIAKTQFAVAFVVTAVGPKLSTIQRSEQPAPANLTGNGGQRILCRCRALRGILGRIGHATAGAAIGIAHENPPKLVDGDVVEVEQIAAWVAAPLVPDAAALHR